MISQPISCLLNPIFKFWWSINPTIGSITLILDKSIWHFMAIVLRLCVLYLSICWRDFIFAKISKTPTMIFFFKQIYSFGVIFPIKMDAIHYSWWRFKANTAYISIRRTHFHQWAPTSFMPFACPYSPLTDRFLLVHMWNINLLLILSQLLSSTILDYLDILKDAFGPGWTCQTKIYA